jgi:phage major head subunit gpT-like protein
MQINRPNLDKVYYNLNTRFNRGIARHAPWWQKLAMEVPSSTRSERYFWASLIPGMREWIGERHVHHLSNRSWEISNKRWELTIGVSRDDAEDDTLGAYAIPFEMMGYQASRQPDDLLHKLIKGGKTADCWDGQKFFDTDHPYDIDRPELGTYANLYTGMPLNSAVGNANVEAGYVAMTQIKGEDGRIMNIVPTHLIHAPAKRAVVMEILKTDKVIKANAGANALTTTTNVQQGLVDNIMIPELNDEPEVWYMAALAMPLMPFVHQTRTPLRFVSLTDDGSDNVFNKAEYLYGSDRRNNMGYGLPFLIFRFEP